jgi:unsaturated chondroitin disaccharide hydrolase
MNERLRAAWAAWAAAAERDFSRIREWPADESPHFTEGGRWQRLPVESRSSWQPSGAYEHGNWTAGFAVGVGGLLGTTSDEGSLDRTVRDRLRALAGRSDDTTTHDLGFLFFPSFALCESRGLLDRHETEPAIRAARMLARRFNAAGGYLQAFGAIGDHRSAGTSTIDTMMNLPLLWWASDRLNDGTLFDIARRHARTAARLCLRPDGSSYHLLRFDALTGALVSRGTFQGAGDDSTWSRGQSWGVCGFAWAYAACGEPELLDAAERAAAWFWAHLPDDGVPPWDFADQAPDATRDTSAGVIAALGAWILGRVHPDKGGRAEYARRGLELLLAVAEGSVNSEGDVDGILLHTCYSKPFGLGVDGAAGWGEFYSGLALGLAAAEIDAHVALGFAPGQHPLRAS